MTVFSSLFSRLPPVTHRYHPASVGMFTFFHWLNQTHVAVMSYINAPGGSERDAGEQLQGLMYVPPDDVSHR